MEVSSPLAAMRPSGLCSNNWGGMGSEGFAPRTRRSTGTKALFGPPLGKNPPSYFQTAHHYESSPTSHLVMDMSANFHLDKTPQMPTPRRALFTNFAFNADRTTLTPISASSPTAMDDAMDMSSPLPHKPAFGSNNASQYSPSVSSDADMMMCSSPPAPAPEPTRKSRHDRKKSGSSSRRTSLSKNRQATSFLMKSASIFDQTPPSNKAIPALFGNANSQPIDLDEMFQSSPQSHRSNSSPAVMMDSPLPRMRPFPSGGYDGSPLSSMAGVRKPCPRPKAKVRRTISMFENADDVMSDDKDGAGLAASFMNSPRGAAPGENSTLPSFQHKDDTLRRIEKSTLLDVLEGKYKEHYDEFFIVDCRFEYEYEGGHVIGAINVNTAEALEKAFFKEPRKGRVLLIFHCEYSAHRAPRMAHQLRQRDRQLNMHRYPALFYPDVYILDGGYSSFFMEHKDRCDPPQYVGMNDDSHKRTCEREMGKFRRNTKFGRAQTFHFGSQADNNDGSPIANVTRRSARECSMENSTDQSVRGFTRRAVSY